VKAFDEGGALGYRHYQGQTDTETDGYFMYGTHLRKTALEQLVSLVKR